MVSLKDSLEQLLRKLNVGVPIQKDEFEVGREFLDTLNRYFYQTKDKYISPFHEYWEANHRKILNISVNVNRARDIAIICEDIFANPEKYPGIQTSPPIDREGLTNRQVSNVRFFTSIQDFKINIYKKGRNPFKKFLEKPDWFTAKSIRENNQIIIEFLNYLDATGSQGDKRQKWMFNAATFLDDKCDGDAYNLFFMCDEDVAKVRELIADKMEIGFSRKKADMFIRDMIDWGIWNASKNIETINVASDVNTMRVALRTGLLDMPKPLLASYLDVYCHQYSLMDEMTQEAWRTVWLEWRKLHNNHCPATPASIDYLIYKSIGKAKCLQNARKCTQCVFNHTCPNEKRILKPPKSISIYGQTGWEDGRTDEGGGGGIMA